MSDIKDNIVEVDFKSVGPTRERTGEATQSAPVISFTERALERALKAYMHQTEWERIHSNGETIYSIHIERSNPLFRTYDIMDMANILDAICERVSVAPKIQITYKPLSNGDRELLSVHMKLNTVDKGRLDKALELQQGRSSGA